MGNCTRLADNNKFIKGFRFFVQLVILNCKLLYTCICTYMYTCICTHVYVHISYTCICTYIVHLSIRINISIEDKSVLYMYVPCLLFCYCYK